MSLKIVLAIFCVSFLSIKCKKASQGDDNANGPTGGVSNKTVDEISLQPYKFAQGADTTGNYIATYGFTLNYETQAWFVATTNPADQKYNIKYVGSVPLLSPDSLIWNSGEAMMFPINKELKGKIIFEIYQAGTDKLLKKITASPDSCKIMASFSVFGNRSITPAQIRNAFHYYMTQKQTTGIRYYNTKD